ncbi:MAG: hypothetical protein WKF75_02850 [Singulisphaera sp.]
MPTSPVSAAPVVAGPLLLVGCRDGRLLTVDTLDLRVLEVEHDLTDIAALSLDGGMLVRWAGPSRADPPPLAAVARPPAVDLLADQEEPTGLPGPGMSPIPRISRRSSSGIGAPLPGRGRAGARGQDVIDRPPGVAGLERWRIALVATGRSATAPGVYRLDDFRRSSGSSTPARILTGRRWPTPCRRRGDLVRPARHVQGHETGSDRGMGPV